MLIVHLINTQGPQIYQTKFGPSYRVSYSTSIGLLAVTVVTLCLTWVLVSRSDKRLTEKTMTTTIEEGAG